MSLPITTASGNGDGPRGTFQTPNKAPRRQATGPLKNFLNAGRNDIERQAEQRQDLLRRGELEARIRRIRPAEDGFKLIEAFDLHELTA